MANEISYLIIMLKYYSDLQIGGDRFLCIVSGICNDVVFWNHRMEGINDFSG